MPSPRRRLELRREALVELTPDELSRAAGGATLTLDAGCSLDDVNERLEQLYWKLSIHQHCSWTCI